MMLNISRNNRFLKGLGILFLFLGITSFSFSQAHLGKGRITGTVVDENGKPLEGVLIVVQSLRAKAKFESYTDKKGHFAVAGMGTGQWRVTASKEGYVSSYVDIPIRQLRKNPALSFILKKIKGPAGLKTNEESFQLLDKGNLLLEEEKYDEALGVFEELLTKYSEIYQIHLNIGTCYLKKRELDKAEEQFKLVLDKILETHGDYNKEKVTSLRALAGLGEVFLQKEKFEDAQKYFAQALEISPEDAVSAYNVGEVYFSNQKIDEAIAYFELAIEIKKEWSKPYLKLGYVYLNKGDFDKSLEYFQKFIEMDPESPQVPNVQNIIATIEKMKDSR
ncbi:MAG: tetratricopeptide repeat protein [Candidatus Aminicenantes bacterium]|nr:tetratricopeptide repeat protein [Candidatus Aminicenantes bacterium]